MSKRKSWIAILIVVVAVVIVIFCGHSMWHALLRMHGMH